MAEPFSVHSDRDGRVDCVIPRGELDVATVPALESEFRTVPALDPDLMIAVDLTEITFVDSAGLHLLPRLNKRFPERPRVINGSPSVERLLDLSGARDQLPIISKADDPLGPLT